MISKITKLSQRETLWTLIAMILLILGVIFHPLFFAGALACMGAAILQHAAHRRLGVAMVAIASIYFLIVAGYGVGKDMAQRDNARDRAGIVGK